LNAVAADLLAHRPPDASGFSTAIRQPALLATLLLALHSDAQRVRPHIPTPAQITSQATNTAGTRRYAVPLTTTRGPRR
jgi:hypothetical protein